jgi:hypothetical protein
MNSYKKKAKKIVNLLNNDFEEDKSAIKNNQLNEKVLTKEINKVLKKNELKPINTHLLIKNKQEKLDN